MSNEPLLLRQDDGRGLCTLTLNRPEAFNSLSEELLAALQTELDQLRAVVAQNNQSIAAILSRWIKPGTN